MRSMVGVVVWRVGLFVRVAVHTRFSGIEDVELQVSHHHHPPLAHAIHNGCRGWHSNNGTHNTLPPRHKTRVQRRTPMLCVLLLDTPGLYMCVLRCRVHMCMRALCRFWSATEPHFSGLRFFFRITQHQRIFRITQHQRRMRSIVAC
jgi:hypothetical protein